MNAKSVTSNVERSNFGTVLDEQKKVDEVFLFIPIEAAKRNHFKISLVPEKQVLWDCYIKAAEKSSGKRNSLYLNQ